MVTSVVVALTVIRTILDARWLMLVAPPSLDVKIQSCIPFYEKCFTKRDKKSLIEIDPLGLVVLANFSVVQASAAKSQLSLK